MSSDRGVSGSLRMWARDVFRLGLPILRVVFFATALIREIPLTHHGGAGAA